MSRGGEALCQDAWREAEDMVSGKGVHIVPLTLYWGLNFVWKAPTSFLEGRVTG